MYQWWVFVHLVGVFGMLASHGASIILAFRLRAEHDPERVESMLQLSGASISAFYASLGVLLVGGIAATFEGGLWGYGWIWASIATLVAMVLAMFVVARPYYHRVRFVAGAMAAGSTAVSAEQFEALLRSRRGPTTIAIGSVGLLVILYLMLFKPALGLTPDSTAAETTRPPDVTVAATELSFSTASLDVAAHKGFVLALDNLSSVPHNISINRDGDTILVGDVFTGPKMMTYEIPPLAPGRYSFRCDVHPEQMTGVIAAR